MAVVLEIQEIISIVVAAVAFILFVLAPRGVGQLKISTTQKRRARKTIRYLTVLIALASLLVVWADELHEAALVLSAFAVAIVLANKEVIVCVTGWWLKLSGSHFRIGDRIEVGEYKGDVVDYGLLTTTLMEVNRAAGGERTGSVIVLPNSLYFTLPLRNETKVFSAHWHIIRLVVDKQSDWQRAETVLMQCAEREWDRLKEEINREERDLDERFHLEQKEGKPAVFVSQLQDGRLQLELRVALPVRDSKKVEDRIVRSYLKGMLETKADA